MNCSVTEIRSSSSQSRVRPTPTPEKAELDASSPKVEEVVDDQSVDEETGINQCQIEYAL